MKTNLILGLTLIITISQVALGDPPDVLTDNKSATTSPLKLREVHELGVKRWEGVAKKSADNLAADAELKAELNKAGTHLAPLALRRIAAIESQCNRTFAYSQASYKGFFQMSQAACTDVNIAFTDIDEPTEWVKGCEAGRKFLDLNWERIKNGGVTLKDDEASLVALYIAHNQGYSASVKLWKNLNDNSAATKNASSAMVNNVWKKDLENIEGTAGHKLTELEFYAYWKGAIHGIAEKIQ